MRPWPRTTPWAKTTICFGICPMISNVSRRFLRDTTSFNGQKNVRNCFPKPLPNRTHVIITRQKDFKHEGCIVVSDIEKAIAACPENEDILHHWRWRRFTRNPYHFADQLDITRVHHSFDADVYFPEINPDIWELTNETFHPKDEKHLFDFHFSNIHQKKNKKKHSNQLQIRGWH